MPSDSQSSSGPSRPRRVHITSLRLTTSERRRIRATAHAAGLSVSAFIRRAALGRRIRARRGHLRRDAIYHLSKIGNNINQLARVANTVGEVRAIELLEEAVVDLRHALAELTEPRPR